MQESIDVIKENSNYDILIADDLNADPEGNQWNNLTELTTTNNLSIHVTEPTRITENSSTILDQFVSNFNDRVKKVSI